MKYIFLLEIIRLLLFVSSIQFLDKIGSWLEPVVNLKIRFPQNEDIENVIINAISKQKSTLKLSIVFKKPIFAFVSANGKSRFWKFPPKKWYNIDLTYVQIESKTVHLFYKIGKSMIPKSGTPVSEATTLPTANQ